MKDPASKTPSLVFERIEVFFKLITINKNIDFRTLIPTLTDLDIRYYLYKLLEVIFIYMKIKFILGFGLLPFLWV